MIGAEVRGVAASLGRMSHSGAVDYVALAMASRRVRDLSGRLATQASAAAEPTADAILLRAVHEIIEALIDTNRASSVTVRLAAIWLDTSGRTIEEWEARTGVRPADVVAFPGQSLPRTQIRRPHAPGEPLRPAPLDPDTGSAPDLDPGAA